MKSAEKNKQEVKVLVLAKHLDGGTGTFVSEFFHLCTQYPRSYKLKLLALEKPLYRHDKSSDTRLIYLRSSLRQPYYYRFTIGTCFRIFQEISWSFREIALFQPDVLLTVDAHCAFLGCLYKVFHPKQKLVLTIHNNLRAVTFHKLTPSGRTLMFFICTKLFNIANIVIGVSKGVSSDIRRLFRLKKPVQTIYYGLHDLPNRKTKNDLQFIQKKYFRIISVGRLAPQKDFKNLIYAMETVKRSMPTMQLMIIGDGEDRVILENLTGDLNLEKNITFLGWKNNVQAELLQSDVFVFSSHFEGFGLAMLEAMKLGLPVISTDTPYGPSELLGNGAYGLLVKPSDPDALAKAILLMATNKGLRRKLGKAAFIRSKFFSEQRMLENYHQCFQSLMND